MAYMKYRTKKMVVNQSRYMRIKSAYIPSGFKDIRAGRSTSKEPDMTKLSIKMLHSRTSRTPSMPKMPWSSASNLGGPS